MMCKEFLDSFRDGARFQAALAAFKAGLRDTLCISADHSFNQVCPVLFLVYLALYA